jgi:integrase
MATKLKKSARRRGLHWLDGIDLGKLRTPGVYADGNNLFLRVVRDRVPDKKVPGKLVPGKAIFRSWTFRYSSPVHRVMGPKGLLIGKRRDAGIGPLSKISLGVARQIAQRWHDQVALGIDPIDAKESARRADVQTLQAEKQKRLQAAMTLLKAARAYHEKFVDASTADGRSWMREIESAKELQEVLDRLPGEILASEWLKRLSAMRKRVPTVGLRVGQRLNSIYADLLDDELVKSNPIAGIKPKLVKVAKKDKVKVRSDHHASLPYGQVSAFVAALRAREGAGVRPLEFLILTAARANEAAGAQWSEVDLDKKTWTIPDDRMKGREEHLVPLSDRAVQILKVQRRDQPIGGNFVFPGRNPKKPISNDTMGHLLEKMHDEKLKVDGVGWIDAKTKERATTHGFRSSFSDWAGEIAQRARPELARRDVIDACLAHQEANQVKRAYSRSKFDDERRELLQWWSTYIEPKTATVTKLQKKTARK